MRRAGGTADGAGRHVGLGQGLAERVLTQVDGPGQAEGTLGTPGHPSGLSVLLDLQPEGALETA